MSDTVILLGAGVLLSWQSDYIQTCGTVRSNGSNVSCGPLNHSGNDGHRFSDSAFPSTPKSLTYLRTCEYTATSEGAYGKQDHKPWCGQASGFVAVDDKGTRWLLETKGAETGEVAAQWCANATQLTGTKWVYLKIPQKDFETLQPSRLEHLVALKPMTLL